MLRVATTGEFEDGTTLSDFTVALARDSTYIELDRAPDSSCNHGWYWEDERIHLCVGTCAIVQENPEFGVELLVGCDDPTGDTLRE